MKSLCVRTQGVRLGFVVAWFVVLTTPCTAGVTFANPNANLLVGAPNTALRIGDASKIIGWTNRSVVKTFGNTVSTAWPEGYSDGAVVGQTGQSGVTIPARTDMIDANSNAIIISLPYISNGTLIQLARIDNNALNYTTRTFSSSIWVLRSRADSTSISLRTMSNTLVALYTVARTTSNALNSFNNTIASNLVVPSANSIDGTVMPKYCTNNYVFHNNGNAWTVRGWVRFNNGFTVMPRASVLMDTLTTVSGGFDLRDTGTLILDNDLYLAHNVTLTDGGNIKGKASTTPGAGANTIFMGGDLTLASTTYARTLHITGDWCNTGTSGDLIIDGGGHTLNIGDRAQIFVDQNVTLTLRNMTIKTGPKSLLRPAIQLASPGSKLALDNVLLDLGADFHFLNGQLFIHDEVAVTGTSAFVYNSPWPSYITSGATWSFESGTTFSVAPATYTDQPYTAGTATSNNFIVFADASAALSFDNCSFLTTFTGLRLRSGMVLFNDKVAVNTQAGVDLNPSTPVTEIGSGVATGSTPYAFAWAPNSRFLAVANGAVGTLQMYQFNPASGLSIFGGAISGFNAPDGISWSPDGRFFIVVNSFGASSTMQVYRFNGASTPTPVGAAVITGSTAGLTGVSFSSDGRFIAVVNKNATTLQVFRFDGVSTPAQIGSNVTTSTQPYSVAWSPDNRFLVVSCYSGQTIAIYRFNGSATLTLVGSTVSLGGNVPSVTWSPDGRFLAALVETGNIYIYSFNGASTPSSVTSVPTGTGTDKLRSIHWSPDGRYLVFSDITARNIYIYRFDGSSNLTQVGSAISVGSSGTASASALMTAAWSPDGLFIAAFNAVSNGVLHVFGCNFVASLATIQGFSNGLIFGNSALGAAQGLGSAYDTNVQLFGGAVVKAKGMIKDDSA
jgi:WD40 repeat protein